MATKHVLMVGLNPSNVSFSAERGLNAERVRAAGEAAQDRLTELGCEVQSFLVDPGASTEDASAEAAMAEALAGTAFDCIMIGAGLRALVEHTILFEKLMNVIHRHAPSASLCFNTHPTNAVEAVLRWL